MMTDFISKGFVIGLSIAALVGPITILCIQRTLAYGIRKGIITGAGSSVANSIYCLIAGVSLAEITNILVSYEGLVVGAGGVILALFGIAVFRTPPLKKDVTEISESSFFKSFISAFLISLTNPMTILLFVAFYTRFEQNNLPSGFNLAIHLPLGVFIGSISWWLTLCLVVNKTKGYLSPKILTMANKISGIILIALACYAFFTAFRNTV